MSITHNLKTIRTKYRISQEAFGEMLSVTRQMINTYEQGTSTPSIDFLLRLSSLINIPVDQLFYQKVQDEDLPVELPTGIVEDPAVHYARQKNLFDVRNLVREVEELRRKIEALERKE